MVLNHPPIVLAETDFMNVLELAEPYGRYNKVTAKKGGEFHGPCPVCGGNDRFHIWPEQRETGTYWCRQCGIEGDIIQFLMDVEKVSFPEACRQLGRELPAQQDGRTPQPRKPAADSWQPTTPADPADRWLEKAEKFVEESLQALIEMGDGEGSPLHYLAGRGIRRETAVRFRLGWNQGDKGKDRYRDRGGWGLPEIFKEDGKKKKLWLPIGLVIPCYVQGRLRRVRIRIPNERRTEDFSTPYYVVPGSSSDTFVTNPEAKVFFITEAELDGILIDQEAEGLDHVGAQAMGNSSARPTEYAYRLLADALHIANALDYDPGIDRSGNYKNPGGKEWLWWKERFFQAERWPAPKGKDPGDAFKAGCDLRQWIKDALPPIFHVPAAPARQTGIKKDGKMEFDSQKLEQQMRDTFSRIQNSYDEAGWTWLKKNRPDITKFIDGIEGSIDGFFEKEDAPGLVKALATLEEAYGRAWNHYGQRPPVIARCRKEDGDCVCCGECDIDKEVLS